MRIIAGELKGRRIDAPKGTATRPTSDFVRESAFNLIGPVDGAEVLDLYAGSGALGIEAISRGADRAVFIDSSRDACRTIGANLDKLGLRATVLCQDALRALAAARGSYDLILADPPYDFDSYDRLAAPLTRLLSPDGLFVLQTPAAAEPALEGLETRTSRKYGSARLTLFEL
ncbi:MAG TPA: 16S rRNA (guanine(966)-N(2))-methyltransferase RsmD [Gaiellaceae bacterium]